MTWTTILDYVVVEDLVKLALAMVVGGLIGAEREFRDKAAGFRTIIFICTGATLFTIFSLRLAAIMGGDPVRIAANVVSGVGFLGAGAILRGEGRIIGLTTASTIWLAAALGMGIGGGDYILVSVATVVILIVLWVFPFFERWIDDRRETRLYRVICPADKGQFKHLAKVFHDCGLRVRPHKHKRGDDMVCLMEAFGKPECHERVVEILFDDENVKEFYF